MTVSFDKPTVFDSPAFIELDSKGQLLRLYLEKDQHQLGRDPEWADLKIPVDWGLVSRRQAIFVREGNSYRIFDGDGTKSSTHGIFVNGTRISASSGYLLTSGAQLEIGKSSDHILLTYSNAVISKPPENIVLPSNRRLLLKGIKEFPIKLGRAPNSDVYSSMQLDAPTVSRLHAKIYTNGNGAYTLHNLSANGTFVNGKRIDKHVQLQENAKIKIGPYTLLFTQEALEIQDTGSQIRLDVHNLRRKVKDKQGQEKFILDDVSLVIEPGQLVALVGGSGAGKSTLMKALLGIEPVSEGEVFINGDNLRQNWAVYRSHIGYVPQDDIVHLDLTVEEVLSYACKLRLPADTDIKQIVNKTLDQVKLIHVRHNFIRNLSGGQRKRVSIGVELLADPKLFFLDEPTSGLDPGLDKEMMRLLRELADQGRTIVLVTHATANLEVCDRIVFMGRGGKLCYFGPPQNALNFFEMPSNDLKYFSDIYIKLDQGATPAAVKETVDHWSQKYRKSPEFKKYVESQLSKGKKNPKRDVSIHTGSPLRQLWLLSQRYFQLVKRDNASLIFSCVSGPVAIALTGWILNKDTPFQLLNPPKITQAPLALKVLFIFTCIGIWIGLSSSVREIVKEAAIYARERLINLGLFPYIGSKVLIRASLTLIQTVLVAIAILISFKSPTSSLIPWYVGLVITTFLTLFASVSLSLMLSAFVKNENQANSLLPLIMIPQIILSGVLFELKGAPGKLGWLTISRWSMGAYGSLVDVNKLIPANTPTEIIKTSSVYSATWKNLGLNWGVLIIHISICVGISLWLQKRKDIV